MIGKETARKTATYVQNVKSASTPTRVVGGRPSAVAVQVASSQVKQAPWNVTRAALANSAYQTGRIVTRAAAASTC